MDPERFAIVVQFMSTDGGHDRATHSQVSCMGLETQPKMFWHTLQNLLIVKRSVDCDALNGQGMQNICPLLNQKDDILMHWFTRFDKCCA